MGVLDDAIREHLELKRRRGADPADIERAEREALGPVRRAPEETELADFPEPALTDHGDGFDGEDEEDWSFDEADRGFAGEDEPFGEDDEEFTEEPFAAEPPTRVAQPFEEDDLFEDEPAAAAPEAPPEPEPSASPRRRFRPRRRREEDVVEPTTEFEEPEAEEHAAPGAPQPEPQTPPPAPAHAGQETVEYDVSKELGHGPEEPPEEGDEEDVLEETPEFLQDTPDHDRLWFEQRPPKDFDFDG